MQAANRLCPVNRFAARDPPAREPCQGERIMMSAQSQAENLRKAIENLINVKLHDTLSRPGGLDRLLANRATGVASFAVRQAERQLEESIAGVLDPIASGEFASDD
jgi:hypothetical protein